MSRLPKKRKQPRLQVKVSIKGAGEFIVGVPIDLSTLHDPGVEFTASGSLVKKRAQTLANIWVTRHTKVTPLRGELVRLTSAYRRKYGA